MRDLEAARTYAQALFAEAQKENQLLACRQGLEQMTRSVTLQPGLRDVLMHPMISLPEKERVLHSVLGEFSTPLLERFFLLVIERHRFDLLPLIKEDFQEALDRLDQILPLQVRSAFRLTESQKEQLRLRLEEVFRSKVRMAVKVDPELIGGFVARSKERVLDQSLSGQLAKLEQQLIS